MRLRFVVGLALSCFVLPFGLCAQAQSSAPPSQAEPLLEQTCRQVMGLSAGQTYFARCLASLGQAHALASQAQANATAYATCRDRGLQSGSAGFATCVLDQSDKPSASVSSHEITFRGEGDTEAGRSFYEVAPHIRVNRERYACAQVGLVPGTALFGQCVTNLDAAFLADLN